MGENAKVSDVLEFSSIGEDVTRQTYSFDLKEKMYQPLNSIL
jgi:hypothetical protein